MANKSLFQSYKGSFATQTDILNHAGGRAYEYEARHKLAQLAVTGTLGTLFYQDAVTELENVIKTSEAVSNEFLAKTAIYAHKKGKMKDLPALLLALLASRDSVLLARAFPHVVTNGRMLRNFVQIMRSGQTGRKSLGTRPKALVGGWLNSASDYQLLQASIGNNPSLADIIKMVHPKPRDESREALFAWLIGKPCEVSCLPRQVRDYLAYKENPKGRVIPDVPFQMLTSLELDKRDWTDLALKGSWNMIRMNLNTFLRHGVFDKSIFGTSKTLRQVASILKNEKRIRKANAFPYQLMTTYQSLSSDMPRKIRSALHEAMEISVSNVPVFSGDIVVCPDVSGSMSCPVTGWRNGATTTTCFVDVASLVATSVLRKKKKTTILPFDFEVRRLKLDPKGSILLNAQKLASLCGGGTDCSAPLKWLNRRARKPDLVIIVSDNESWIDQGRGRNTALMREWEILKKRNPNAKLVCIDIAPYGSAQVVSRKDILTIGGFSDAIFEQIAHFADGEQDSAYWVQEIEAIELA